MTLRIYDTIEQHSDEWYNLRLGMVTASTIHKLITAGRKVADNETSRGLIAQLVAERINGFADETYVSSDMEFGSYVEPIARDLYAEHYAPVTEVGYIVNEFGGHKLGFSPDGLVGADGLIEIKSRRPKIQLRTILDDRVPAENMAQIQTGLLVSERAWCDYVSFSGGLPLYVTRVLPDPDWQAVILEALTAFEETAAQMLADYTTAVVGRPTTERVMPLEEIVI